MSSNLIKARTLEATGQRVVIKHEVQLAFQQAKEIVERAENEARSILTEARREAQEILVSARQEGYQNGIAEWHDALSNALRARDAYLAENETALLKLAVRIAEKLIGAELQLTPDTIADIVAEALRAVRRAKTLAIQVHPADLAVLEERLSTSHIASGASRPVELIPNASLTRGGCIVESDIGIVDARLETQLESLERALTGKTAT